MQKSLSEHNEAVLLSNWLRTNNYYFSKIPNETFTKSWSQKRKNSIEGVAKGFPDYVIVLHRMAFCFIELKKAPGKKGGANGSKLDNPDQLIWISLLSQIENSEAKMCQGHEEAIEFITYCEQK